MISPNYHIPSPHQLSERLTGLGQMAYADALADHRNLVANPGTSAGSGNANAALPERRKAEPPRDGMRLSRGRPEDAGRKKIKLCRYYGSPGGECLGLCLSFSSWIVYPLVRF